MPFYPNTIEQAARTTSQTAADRERAAGTFGGGESVANGSNPVGGFAGRMGYTPEALGALWESPWTILPDVFRAFKQPGATSGPGYQALRDIGADPLTLYNIMVGGKKSMAGQKGEVEGDAVGNYANWLASLYGTLGSRGGRGFAGQELLQNIWNPDKGSTLEQLEAAGDASTQLRTVFNLIREATNAGVNPVAARAYQAAAARMGDLAVNQTLSQGAGEGANAVSVAQTLRKLMAGQGYNG